MHFLRKHRRVFGIGVLPLLLTAWLGLFCQDCLTPAVAAVTKTASAQVEPGCCLGSCAHPGADRHTGGPLHCDGDAFCADGIAVAHTAGVADHAAVSGHLLQLAALPQVWGEPPAAPVADAIPIPAAAADPSHPRLLERLGILRI